MITGLPYKIEIEENLLDRIEEELAELPQVSRYIIITDDNTKKLFGDKILKSLPKAELLSFKPGENSKSRETKAQIEDQMLDLECKRDTMILALGGGVVGDLAGFVAATFMRGIPYVQIPTTLLAMVDSPVGGKTAVDTRHGKNLIGAFWPPSKVLIDVAFLKTLPDKHLIGGLIEAVKMFMTSDAESLKFARENLDKILARDPAILKETISRAVQNKANVVARDERESNERAVLNFGHTVGHAMELLSDYKLTHGHAVALGILVEAKLAHISNHLSEEDFQTIVEIIKSLNFDPKEIEGFAEGELIDAMEMDKKSRGHIIKYVILNGIGSVLQKDGQFAHVLDTSLLNQALHGW